MGRTPNTEPSVLVEATVNQNGRTTYKSAVRYAYNVRTWLGTYADREEAARVAQHFITTGERDTRNALKPGPVAGLKPRKKRVDNRKGRVRNRKATAVIVAKPAPQPTRNPDRLKLIRRIGRSLY